MQQRLQPGGERHEDAEADEHQAAQRAHRRQRPQRSRGAALDRGVLLALCTRATQDDRQGHRRTHSEDRLEHQQPLQLPMRAQRRAEQQRQEHPDEAARGAHRDTARALIGGQVLAGELADGAQHDRLRDRDHHLAGHRPDERLAAQTHQPAERDQRPARRQRRAKPAIEQDSRRDREDHVEQREDLREPADGADRDPVAPGRFGRDRRVAEPQHLRRRAHQAVGDDHAPAACLPGVVLSPSHPPLLQCWVAARKPRWSSSDVCTDRAPERDGADADQKAEQDVDRRGEPLPVLGETVRLEHPAREGRVGAERGGARQ